MKIIIVEGSEQWATASSLVYSASTVSQAATATVTSLVTHIWRRLQLLMGWTDPANTYNQAQLVKPIKTDAPREN